jgi:hypothetical protein
MMKIGIVVGQTEAGKFETIGEIGDMLKCKARLNKIVSDDGVYGKKKYIKVILSDMNRDALKTRSCPTKKTLEARAKAIADDEKQAIIDAELEAKRIKDEAAKDKE